MKYSLRSLLLVAILAPPLLALGAYVCGVFREEKPIFEQILWPTEGMGIASIACWVTYRASGQRLFLVLAGASLVVFVALAACGFFM